MKKILWITFGVALIALMFFRLAANKKASEERVYVYDKEKPIPVQVDTIRRQSLAESNTYRGTFEPNKETKVTADIQGKIKSVFVDVGSYVSKGQPLVQLDNELLKLQLRSSELQIEGLQNDEQRYTVLAEADAIQGVQLEKTRLALRSALVQKATLTEQVERSTIRAPFSGIVTAKLTEAGSFAAPGVPLLQITDISALRFTINIPENDLKHFSSGRIYKISVDALPHITLSGKLVMVGSKANTANIFPVQFMVSNTTNSDIRSGMFGKVTADVAYTGGGIAIPSSSVLVDDGKTRVYVVENGKAIIRTIAGAEKSGNRTIVGEGLSEGDIIIVSGFVNLFDGANIIVSP